MNFAPQPNTDTALHAITVACQAQQERGTTGNLFVSKLLHDCSAPMSDEELELHIAHANALERAAIARWERYGDFGDRGEADMWAGIKRRAMNARGAVYVARIRRERGLD